MQASLAPASATTTLLNGRTLALARAGWLALAAFGLGLFVVALPSRYAQLVGGDPAYQPAIQQLGLSERSVGLYFLSLELAVPVAFTFVALLIFWRKSNDWMTQYISLDLLMLGLTIPPILAALIPARPGLLLPIEFLTALAFGLSIIGYYIFPDGRLVPRWSRWLAAACVVWLAVRFTAAAVTGANFSPDWATAVFVGLYGAGIYAQLYRYRRVSSPAQRQQTKWAIWGFVPAFLGFCAFSLPPLAVAGLTEPGYNRLVYLLVMTPIFIASLVLVPVGVFFGVLRYRLWDIDLVLGRSLAYGTLTAALGVTFLGSALLLQFVFPALTGGQQSGLALVVAALAMGVLFQPVRRRLQAWVDRRYYPEALAPTMPTAPPSGPGIAVGARLGAHEVVEFLGRGGMADVFRGRHTALGRPVAIKVLNPSLAAESDFRQRFEREARTVASLKHPNIVEVFDYGEVGETFYMIMEYIGGYDLAEHLRQGGRLSLAQARVVAAGVAGALDYAHAHGVVHRDVKPSNVLLEPTAEAGTTLADPSPSSPVTLPSSFRPVLTDFGIARLVESSARLTATGAIGTLEYIAPEQIVAARDVDGRADVYSMGVMLYEMLTGHLPFSGDNPGALVLAHLQKPAPDPQRLRPDLPEPAARAILRALSKDPGDRFRTAGELAEALS